ncbi:Re/Si-specific NAD(P)(+) transhydrogenase subunit alpha [Aliifodinibius sp. S!AR15-10]|uniref:Re/Si-specific NAD(P)(+) transhydrogenase subunit alpha n=1 Tax=Aliifodinibius sp. S!AR15-10 TaxID=2950437 RepID=UPI00285F589B|nr:Re/Si-specific NAD(P)(+) transhydrogenase subunit alpha [Aliifodinibius sp. S!AR15-10]MDR8392825.1 Re/Si-specific NAD(P)(+) transhydrogenase subunit alpha [Aliifodinibius sp. S!AR15-10]
MIIAVPKETGKLEKRVALIPETAKQLVDKDFEVWIEKDAGHASNFLDSAFEEAGAQIVADRDKLFSKADLLLSINTPPEEDLGKLQKGSVLVCFLWALQNEDTVDKLQQQGITALGMDAVPRISRAQNMDALSSMSSIAGYKSALIGANELDRYLPMMMTAAGTIAPARVLVLGAGVAGLQAIATTKRLGAKVEAFDIRPEVKEQVESLGASFVEVPDVGEDTQTEGGYAKELSEDKQERQRQVIHEHAKKSNIVITTALIPGKPAPLLITEQMVKDMQPGSVVVDLAAEQGGNCELTEPGENVVKHEVKLIGPLDLPSQLAYHASKLYSKNMLALLDHLIEEGELHFDFEDEITLKTTITHDGEIISPMLKESE